MNKEVFRQKAVDQITAPDRQDEILTVTTPGDWIGLFAIGLVLASALVWGQQGRVSKRVEGQGVLVLTGGVVNVVSEGAGRVRDLRVKTGQRVDANQVIGSISQPALEDKLKAQRESLAELQRERERAGNARSEGLRLQSAALTNQRENLRREIADQRQQIKIVTEQIQVDEELLSKGLITRQQVLATRQKRAMAESSIANLEAQLKQLESSQFQNETQVTQADREAVARINELQRSIQLLEKELTGASLVRSPYAGKVIELKVNPGGLVSTGDPFVSLEPTAESVEAIVYVSSVKAKELRPGMAVEVAPTSIQREEYGYMRGRVLSVSEFPATRAAVMRNFENESLANALAASGPVNEVRVELDRDANTASGFKWSTSQGPPVRITSGTLCSAAIVTREQTPLSLVVPFLKQAAGLN